ncbi:MAG: hypothetical protein AAB393_01490 [Bacteroidota bacterium]
MRIRVTIAFLAVAVSSFADETNRADMLTETVAVAHQRLQAHDYSNAVRRLFCLTNETEVAAAAVHLQRPKCLALYEQLFAQLVSIKPTLDGEPARAASFKCPEPIVVGTNSLNRYDEVEIMFLFNGGQWIFHDPSFERRLGRRMTSKK